MTTTELIDLLKKNLSKPLPGVDSHIKLAPKNLENDILNRYRAEKIRYGAVMIMLFEENDRIYFPVILRNKYNGVHSGQISLPGGKCEPHDKDNYCTACRETEEEIGVKSEKLFFIGELSPFYVIPSNFMTYPFVSYHKEKPLFKPSEIEVQETINVDLFQDIIYAEIVNKNIVTARGFSEVPGFMVKNHFIWGATAMILSEFKDIILKDISIIS